MNWTKEQEQAIELRGKNILVAAAAGSGKTTILVERIKKLIIDDGISIDKMLVVTFTNAAASEMREKIVKAINKELEEAEANGRDTAFLRKQLDIIYRANISTFHAFGIEVIKENFHFLGMEPGFGICNDAESTLLMEAALDDLIEEKYELEDEDFLDFVDAYGSERNDYAIRNIIKAGQKSIMSLPNPWQWLDDKNNQISNPKKLKAREGIIGVVIEYCIESLYKALSYNQKATALLRNANLKVAFAKLQEEGDAIEKAIKALQKEVATYDEMGQAIAQITFPTFKITKEEKDDYALIKETVSHNRNLYKKIVTTLRDSFFYDAYETICQDLESTSRRFKTLSNLIEEFDQRYKEQKRNKNLLDFSDIEHYALQILEDNAIAESYRNRFEYIFVDEYQDSNLVQEEIISKIARENNRFLVGDVKQSIYKFRLAEPEIFHGRYKEFALDSNENSIKIDLNRNYRSKANVINTVNLFFNELMDEYDEAAALHKGDAYEGELDYKSELHLIDDALVDSDQLDDSIVQIEKTQKEALMVAKIIEDNLGKEIWDSKQNIQRKVQKKDIVILMRSVKSSAEIFYNVLMEHNIPTYIDDNEGYFDTIEINNMISLLSVIDNRKQDIPLISTLHSEVFGFTLDDLIDIRIQFPKGPFYSAWMGYAKDGRKEELKVKCQESIEKIAYWKKLQEALPLDKFLWDLMIESGFYLAMGALPGGVQRQANLRSLVDKAIEYQEKQTASLFNFINYINTVKGQKVATGQVKLVGENDDIVRIMTIHKSKGLEFPVVILAGMGRQRRAQTKDILFHKDLGIGIPVVNYKEHWKKKTILEKIIKAKNDKEVLEEDIRVFYVALTRAKDKLILVGTPKNLEKLKENMDLGISSESSFLDMIGDLAYHSPLIPIFEHGSDEISKNIYQRKRKLDKVLELFDNQEHIEDSNLAQEVAKRLQYKYPYEEAVNLKSKYSVSELNSKDEKHFDFVAKKAEFNREPSKLSAAERGTLYHKVMEHIPFEEIGEDAEDIKVIIEKTIEKLESKEILTPEEIETIEVSEIVPFFLTDIGKRACMAAKEGKLYKEKPFTYAMELDGEKVLIQGIIDAFFYEENQLVLLDYKTNYINKSAELIDEKNRIMEMYQGQIRIYRRALEEGKGIPVKEAYIYINGLGQFVSME